MPGAYGTGRRPLTAHCPARVLIDDFHHIRHLTALPPPRFVCLGAPLATCALPKGVTYLLTYLLIVGSVQGFRLVSPPEGASYDSRDGLALRIPFSHNGSGAGAPASVSESLGEESLGESLGECLGECLRFISASFAAAASACAWSECEIVWA
jgi:hypothetical protein